MFGATVIFAFARSAMPVLHTLVRGASACLISPATRNGSLVVPIWVGRWQSATIDSLFANEM